MTNQSETPKGVEIKTPEQLIQEMYPNITYINEFECKKLMQSYASQFNQPPVYGGEVEELEIGMNEAIKKNSHRSDIWVDFYYKAGWGAHKEWQLGQSKQGSGNEIKAAEIGVIQRRIRRIANTCELEKRDELHELCTKLSQCVPVGVALRIVKSEGSVSEWIIKLLEDARINCLRKSSNNEIENAKEQILYDLIEKIEALKLPTPPSK